MARPVSIVSALYGVCALSCGGPSDGSMSTADTSTTTPTPVSTAGTPGAPVALPVPTVSPVATPTFTPGNFFITISGLRFSPLNLTVPPGGTVNVQNLDHMPHSVTSEQAPGAFTPGKVNGIAFDTGEFTTGTRSFTIPTGAMGGTVVPFFCIVHGATMATPTGTITITTGPNPPSSSPAGSPATPTANPSTMPPATTPISPAMPMPAGPY